MKTLTLAERRQKLGEEIAAARERARHREDLTEIGVGDLLADLNDEVGELGDDDHEGISNAERRLEDVHRHLDKPPAGSDD